MKLAIGPFKVYSHHLAAYMRRWTPTGWVSWRRYIARANKGVDPDEYAARLAEMGVSE